MIFTRAQLLAGDWDAYEGGRFKREWFKTYTFRSGGVYGKGEYCPAPGSKLTKYLKPAEGKGEAKKCLKLDDLSRVIKKTTGLSPMSRDFH